MDKPVSTRENVSTKINIAKQILDDYNELAELYTKKIKESKISFSLMSQRRFHPAFQKIKELIKECYDKTNCPVTSIQSFHSDGQWRMPSELIDIDYHSYCYGYGKCSHSGYHFFDIVPFLTEVSYSDDKKYDNISAYSTLIRPLDFLQQIKIRDYNKIFGEKEFSFHNKYSMEEFQQKMKEYGEIDVFTNLEFKRGENTVTLASINLIHNGLSRRHWLSTIGKDLYKGNGRIRQEQHIIQQGPFQAIHYHSYQSREVNPEDNEGIYEVGGEYHLDLYIFKNSQIIGGKEFEKISIKVLDINIMEGKSRGHQENARAKGFIEFLEFLEGKRTRKDMTSDFLTHKMASIITSAIYQSIASQFDDKNPKICIKIK